HTYIIENLEKEMEDHSKDVLADEEYIKPKLNQSFVSSKTQYTNTEKGTSFEKNIYKFQNYLKDFSLIEEQEAANVHLWDSQMIWCSMISITADAYEHIRVGAPSYLDSSGFSYNYTVSTNVDAREVASASPGAGGGGAGSAGGGGGSFGGGSGGCVR